MIDVSLITDVAVSYGGVHPWVLAQRLRVDEK